MRRRRYGKEAAAMLAVMPRNEPHLDVSFCLLAVPAPARHAVNTGVAAADEALRYMPGLRQFNSRGGVRFHTCRS